MSRCGPTSPGDRYFITVARYRFPTWPFVRRRPPPLCCHLFDNWRTAAYSVSESYLEFVWHVHRPLFPLATLRCLFYLPSRLSVRSIDFLNCQYSEGVNKPDEPPSVRYMCGLRQFGSPYRFSRVISRILYKSFDKMFLKRFIPMTKNIYVNCLKYVICFNPLTETQWYNTTDIIWSFPSYHTI